VSVSTAAPSLPPVVVRQRNVLLVILVGLAAIGWIVFLDRAREPMDMDHGMGPDLTMGRSWPLFAGTWVAMMVAMMFPAAAPMVLLYGRMRRRDPTSVTLFTASYIALWISFGAVAYLLSAGVEFAASGSEWVAMHWGRVGGVLVALAGVYQLTPLKDVCLRQCRSPLAFVMSQWRDGRMGAVTMGLTHGLYCMGCCWLLFLVLIPVGMMNVAAMAAVAVVVFIEKVVSWGRPVGLIAGVALVVSGVAVVLEPALLPTVA
jgi:predicted metal-binding membrane protein